MLLAKKRLERRRGKSKAKGILYPSLHLFPSLIAKAVGQLFCRLTFLNDKRKEILIYLRLDTLV